MSDKKLVEKRCMNCNALLFKASLTDGKVEIKCKCGTINSIEKIPERRFQDRLSLNTK